MYMLEVRVAEIPKVEVRIPSLAERLLATDKLHLQRTAEILVEGGIVVMAFNGVYGIFGDADNPEVVKRIIDAKNRPPDKKLILVAAPEDLPEHVDFEKSPFSHQQIVQLQREVHALGVILPASKNAPQHLVVKGETDTILSVWTEYDPVRSAMTYFRGFNRRAFVGTSANKAGEPTHHRAHEVWEDFKFDVNAVMIDSFDHLPEHRRKSTSIVDLTKSTPRLHREGNVTKDEVQEALKKHGFPELYVGLDTIKVQPRR